MQSNFEKLSALVDGELQDKTLLDELNQDEQLKQKWSRYHLVGDVLRKEVPELTTLDLSDSIAKALDQEPTVLAPKTNLWNKVPGLAQVVPLFRQTGQYAIAASVAAAMIIGVQVYNQPSVEEPFVLAPNASIPGVVGRISGVSLEQSRPLQNEGVIAQRRRINALILDHQTQMKLKPTHENESAQKHEGKGDQPNQ